MVESVFRFIIIGIIIAIGVGLLGTVLFSWTLDTSPYIQGLTGFLSVVFYVLPIGELMPIVICFIAMMSFRTVVALIKTIWDIIHISG